MFLQKWIILQKAKSIILFLSPFPLIFSPKTEKEKGSQKEEIEKIKKKKRKNFLRFFPVYPLIFLPKKKGI